MAIGDKKSAVMQSDIVNDFTTGGAKNVLSAEMGKTLAQRPNPNLLDNWYFPADSVIDQRQEYIVPSDTPYYSDTGLNTQAGTLSAYTTAIPGNGTYGTVTISGATYYVAWSAAVRGYAGAARYSIDRWLRNTVNCACFVEGEGIRTAVLSDISISAELFTQRMELPNRYAGQTLTLSFLINDITPGSSWYLSARLGIGANESYVSAFTKDFNSAGLITMTFTIPDDASTFESLRMGVATRSLIAGSSISVKAAKLELGTTQTLAHQDENGNWVLNDPPPNKQEELAKCQRYQLMPNSNQPEVLAGNVNSTGTAATCFLPLPVTMRARPTFTYNTAQTSIRTYDGTVIPQTDISAINVVSVEPNGLILSVTATGLTTKTSVSVLLYFLVIDANL